MSDLPAEFRLIARHFRPLAGPGALDLQDDAAVFALPPGREIVVAADAMVAGVHFLPDDPPDLVGRKLLRVNLSDLAAMGAAPLGYLMTVSAPRATPDGWFAGFAAGLAADQAEFGLTLLGGDTTSTPGPVSLSLTILGHVAPGAAVRRAGARAGDGLWVTGTVGDGALGLLAARGEVPDPDGWLAGRYRLPRPRLGFPLAGRATAAMDVSDGLVQDAGHLCRAGGVAAVIEAARVPLSAAAAALVRAERGAEGAAGSRPMLERVLTGGDDYELVFSLPPGREQDMLRIAARVGIPAARIGRFVEGSPAVTVLAEDGAPLRLSGTGWSHFP